MARHITLLLLLLVLPVTLLAAACGDDDEDAGTTPTPSATDSSDVADPTATPDGSGRDDISPSPTPEPAVAPGAPTGEQPLYLSLGDSLAAGIGATNRAAGGWAALVALSLPDYDFVNLGIPGNTSQELLHGSQMPAALAEIESRATDSIQGNETAVITLEIGGNDLLDIYFDLVLPGDCGATLTEALARPVCVNALENALVEFRTNLNETLTTLQAATDAPIFLMTLYNPFSGGASTIDAMGQLSLEGQEDTPFPQGLNDVIREVGTAHGVTIVEWYELFLGKQSEYIALDFIHPNDTGHQVMAGAVIAAMAQAGLPGVD